MTGETTGECYFGNTAQPQTMKQLHPKQRNHSGNKKKRKYFFFPDFWDHVPSVEEKPNIFFFFKSGSLVHASA